MENSAKQALETDLKRQRVLSNVKSDTKVEAPKNVTIKIDKTPPNIGDPIESADPVDGRASRGGYGRC